MWMNAPIKQQSQTSKKQRVKNMIDDLWLLSNSSVFKSEVGFHWLAAVLKQKYFQHHDIKPVVKSVNVINVHWSLEQKHFKL